MGRVANQSTWSSEVNHYSQSKLFKATEITGLELPDREHFPEQPQDQDSKAIFPDHYMLAMNVNVSKVLGRKEAEQYTSRDAGPELVTTSGRPGKTWGWWRYRSCPRRMYGILLFIGKQTGDKVKFI